MINTIQKNLTSRSTQVALLVTFAILFLVLNTIDGPYFWSDTREEIKDDMIHSVSSSSTSCNWQLGDPVLLNIKTTLGVNYDGGHWFHMSENLMTLHSILRNERTSNNAHLHNHPIYSDRYLELSMAKEVYYNFDKRTSKTIYVF